MKRKKLIQNHRNFLEFLSIQIDSSNFIDKVAKRQTLTDANITFHHVDSFLYTWIGFQKTIKVKELKKIILKKIKIPEKIPNYLEIKLFTQEDAILTKYAKWEELDDDLTIDKDYEKVIGDIIFTVEIKKDWLSTKKYKPKKKTIMFDK